MYEVVIRKSETILTAFVISAFILAVSGKSTYATTLVLVDEFPSPIPHPAFALDFDYNTNTLWGVSNASSNAGGLSV
ncbi:MAG: hypothetical protein JSV09_04615 [Thermoplasmata archaeon]|nr:MAG: hypothetical protein JSV09_04615 [Thermoplasmata archaeon]